LGLYDHPDYRFPEGALTGLVPTFFYNIKFTGQRVENEEVHVSETEVTNAISKLKNGK